MCVDFKQYNCIGILGGTFNPVHAGHIMMAEKTHEQIKDIEKIVFIPNNKTAYKNNSDIADNSHRLKMLQLASSDMDYALISDIEINRGGITYTYDTLCEIRRQNPTIKIYFIIGADSLYSFEKWYKFDEVFQMCILAVINRDDSRERLINAAQKYIKEYGAQICILDAPKVDVSSTDIRNKIKNGISIDGYVFDDVKKYIMEQGLYK